MNACVVFATEHFELSGKAGVGIGYGSGLYADIAVAVRTGIEALCTMPPGTVSGGLYADAVFLPKSGDEDAFGYTVTGGIVFQFGAFGNSDTGNKTYKHSSSNSEVGGGDGGADYSSSADYSSDSSYSSYTGDSSNNSYTGVSSYSSYTGESSYSSYSSENSDTSYSTDTTEETSSIEQWDYEFEHYGCSTDNDCSHGRCLSSQCVDCLTNADCSHNYVCTKNQCIPGCTSDMECSRGQSCKHSRCVWNKFKPGTHHKYEMR